MKMRYLVAVLALLALAGSALACGGSDDGNLTGVRTQKGLAVAALAEGLTARQTDTTGGTAAVPAQNQSGSGTAQRATGYDSIAGRGAAGINASMPLQQQTN